MNLLPYFQFKIGFEELITRTLWLAMWNHDTFGHNDFLGEVMLPLDTYQDSGFSWDDPSPNWYPLRERVSLGVHIVMLHGLAIGKHCASYQSVPNPELTLIPRS